MVQIKSALDSERLDLVEHNLREVGFHIIENVITAEEADEAREAVWKMVEEDIANGHDHSYGMVKFGASGQSSENHLSSVILSSTRPWWQCGNGCSAKMSLPPRLRRTSLDLAHRQAVGILTTRIGRCNLPFRPVR